MVMQNNNYKGCDSEINKTVKLGTIVQKYHVLAREWWYVGNHVKEIW